MKSGLMTKQFFKVRFDVLDTLLAFVPVSILLYSLHADIVLPFFVTGAAIVGITHFMAESTAIIARHVSGTWCSAPSS